MARVCFSCSNSSGAVLDRREAELKDLLEAREYGTALVQSLFPAVASAGWRRCRLHVRDEQGAEIFVMPFWPALGKPRLKSRIKTAFAAALS